MRAKAGDERAMREIYSTYRSQVRGHLFRVLGDDADLDDLVQTVFARAFAALPEFRAESSLKTWLYTISSNTISNVKRLRFRKRRVKEAFAGFLVAAGLDAQHSSTVDSRDEATRMLGHLPPDLLEVFVLYHHEGLTLQEISQVLSRPISSVGDMLVRARKRLRDAAAR